MDVVVVGAGIGGLSAALGLLHAGVEVEVHERAPALREVGAGLALWPNAIRALDDLGVGDRVRTMGGPELPNRLCTPAGRVLSELDGRRMRERYGAPFVTVHRAELLEVLVDAVGRERIHTGRELVGVTPDVGGVRARFADGEQAGGAVLVGADGIRSAVREAVLGDGPPRYRGDTAWRAILRADEVPGPLIAGFEAVGRGLRFGATPMGGGRVQWFAGAVAPAGQQDGDDVLERLGTMFAGWHDPVPGLIAATRTAPLRTDIHDRRVGGPLVRGRVALLGDAAHPMGPDAGQGAGLAIEDAVVLGREVARWGAGPRALQTYEDRRRRRVARVQRAVATLGALARLHHPVLERVRDGVVGSAPTALAWRQLDTLMGSARPGQPAGTSAVAGEV